MGNQPPTLEQIGAAMDAVNAALQDATVPPAAETSLNQLSNVLQAMQDALIEKTEQDLVDALAANNQQLQNLVKTVNDMSENLDNASATLQKVSTTAGTVISVLSSFI